MEVLWRYQRVGLGEVGVWHGLKVGARVRGGGPQRRDRSLKLAGKTRWFGRDGRRRRERSGHVGISRREMLDETAAALLMETYL